MFENQTIISVLAITLIVVFIWILYSTKDNLWSTGSKYNTQHPETFADITYDTKYNLQPGELIISHSSLDKGTIKYYVVPTTSTMDYGYFKQKIDNHQYTFMIVIDSDDANKIMNIIPKVDLITGIPEFVSSNTEEYNLVHNLRYHPEQYRLLYSEKDIDLAPYSITRNSKKLMQPVHDIFIQTIH